ncbi:ATP-dependent helicase HepA [Rubripirellula amarantea]|uniref:ATP-dependent helicase HepA n=2 Tax=Rubripirellula amarantea TaxID=2527999 RepID=A0A5C5WQM8_9BACT|nr:ATP-dependent helicase HepA [Rubripirellula amarantea]
MDLMSDDAISAFGILVGEAIERLVDRHNESLDKQAAMMSVDGPTFSQVDHRMQFDFRVKGNRQKTVECQIEIHEQANEDGEEKSFDSLLDTAFEASPSCTCDIFLEQHTCQHTLASSWLLQEQLARRGAAEVFEFLGELKVDTVNSGRELVGEILGLAEESNRTVEASEETQLQWRIGLPNSRYYSPISINAYEQKPRKNRKGWTKGREVRSYDLLRRDFSGNLRDGRIAALVAKPSYSFEEDHYAEFQALEALVGHENVTWDDVDATPIEVFAAELTLTLVPVEVEGEEESSPENDVVLANEETAKSNLRFRPQLEVAGIRVNVEDCEVILGHSSPVDPLVILVDTKGNRMVICHLRDPKATRMIQYLVRSDLKDTLLDAEAAAKFSVGSSTVDTLIRVNLPPQLAGPIEPVEAELVMELRPRPGAGLSLAIGMHDPRFRQLAVPGEAPDTVPCLTDLGPVRLQRDLKSELDRTSAVVQKFALDALASDGHFRWVATSDEIALDLLAALYQAGEEAPRLIWPEGESLKVRGEITPSALRVQIEDRRDWFGLGGTVSLDGREIPLEQLLAAVRDNRSLVQVGDREFSKISDAFRKRLQQLGDTVVNDRGEMKIADAAVPSVVELFGEDVSIEATARWHASIAKLESLADWNPDKPAGLDATLRDYQLEGYQWLARLAAWGVGGVLADDMGLGKTVQTLAALIERGPDGPALVVAPTSVGDNWVREAMRFAPSLNAHLYRDADRKKLVKSAGDHDIIIVSYQLLQRDAEIFATRTWNTLVLDEAQFVKNSQTKTARAVRAINANWRLGLSGTPLENHLGELWSLFRTLSPGLLGSWDRFRNRFADPIERHKDDERRQSLSRLVRPFILRRTKDKVLKELPPRTEITLQAELSKGERKLYEDARVAALAELSGAANNESGAAGQQRIRTLAWLTRLRQLSCHPRLVESSWKKSSAKMDLFVSLVQELREGNHRALVFSQFVKHLKLIREALDEAGVTYQYLDGATPAKERSRRVDAFQDGEGDLFLISLKAGGTGLNLTAADYVLHLDPWWNPAVEDQATDRAHRIGQERPVTVYRLVSAGTIEEQILELHADKRKLVAGILDGTDYAGKMDTAELIDLIREGAGE